MIKIKLSAGSRYISSIEAKSIEDLQHILSAEDGYVIPVMFIGERAVNQEIDAILLLPDAIFLIDFKNLAGERIEVEGINGEVRRLRNGAWERENNTLSNYEYAARIISKRLSKRLKRERWLSNHPRIYSIMVFTSIQLATKPHVSFAGRDPNNPEPKDGVGACRIEQLSQLISAFRAVAPKGVQLKPLQQTILANVLLADVKPPDKPYQRRIEGYLVIAEHHSDTFLDCKIYMGEGEPIKEPVWIKEYEQVLAPSQKQRVEKEQLVLRHADILHRFPQHKNIVDYRMGRSTDSHLYIILARKPGAFLSELLTGKPLCPTTEVDLQRIPFDLSTRLHILGGLLEALEYLTQQQGFEQSAYRDLRPDNIFVQVTDAKPIAQLFNFDCTRLPGAITKRGHLKEGLERCPTWEDYASPELLEYIETWQTTPGVPFSFTGDVSSDIFSWAIIAWELFTGELPFQNTEAKLASKRRPWPNRLGMYIRTADSNLSPETVHLIELCLAPDPINRPRLTTLRRYFP
jgi:serine/threonine protein kinase